MLNKCLLVPVLILKLKTALAIKSGLTLFGLGLGAGYFFNPSRQTKPSDNDTSIGISNPKQRAVANEACKEKRHKNLSNR